MTTHMVEQIKSPADINNFSTSANEGQEEEDRTAAGSGGTSNKRSLFRSPPAIGTFPYGSIACSSSALEP